MATEQPSVEALVQEIRNLKGEVTRVVEALQGEGLGGSGLIHEVKALREKVQKLDEELKTLHEIKGKVAILEDLRKESEEYKAKADREYWERRKATIWLTVILTSIPVSALSAIAVWSLKLILGA